MARAGRKALALAAITLVMALVCIFLDLGQMWRFYEIITRPNFTSMMTWMVWLYSFYFLLIMVELWVELRLELTVLALRGGRLKWLYRFLLFSYQAPHDDPDSLLAIRKTNKRWMRILGSIGIPLTIAFSGGVGALFATLSSRPYWHHSLFPILFVTGALVSGGALLMAILALFGDKNDEGLAKLLKQMGKLVIALLVFDLVLEWSETSIPMWYGIGENFALYKEMLFGRFWYIFWIVHILLGSLIPIVLILKYPGKRLPSIIGGFLIATTFLAVRLNLVIPGQTTPLLKGLSESYSDPRLRFDYVPSLWEWSVVSFVIACGIAAFFIVAHILPLRTSPLRMKPREKTEVTT